MSNETEASGVPAHDEIDHALALLQVLADRKAAYDEINLAIGKVQGEQIFSTHIFAMDEKIETAVVALLDHILGDELATYFLYEALGMKGDAYIQDHGRRWPIRSVEDVGTYVRERSVLPVHAPGLITRAARYVRS